MPRKTYDFPEVKEESNEISMQRQHENRPLIKACYCNDCDFFFDLGTPEMIQKAANNHKEKNPSHTIAEVH